MTKIEDVRAYERCSVVAVVLRLSLAPREGRIGAIVGDGTGELVATWHLARPTPQLQLSPGTWVTLSGVPRTGDDGGLELRDPDFTIEPHATEVLA